MQELIDQLNQHQPYTGIFAFILTQVFAVAMALLLHNPTKEELNNLEE